MNRPRRSDEQHFLSEPLSPEHRLDDFTCGRTSLDLWLREQALRAQRAGTARTHVWTVRGSLSVRAYYAVAPTQLNRADGLSRSMSAGYTSVPAYLVARLAVDLELQGRGLGAELLLDALELVVEAAELGGGRLVVVDAIDEMARAFYEHHGFTRIGGSDRLVIKVATVADVLRRSKRL